MKYLFTLILVGCATTNNFRNKQTEALNDCLAKAKSKIGVLSCHQHAWLNCKEAGYEISCADYTPDFSKENK